MEKLKHTQSRGFQIVRRSIFSLIVFLGLAWLSFLCVEKFMLEDSSDPNQKGLVWVLIAANFITVLMMPILLLLEFKVYVDGARMGLLLVLHIGPSAFFVAWRPDFICPAVATEQRLCQNMNLAIMVGSWLVPALIVFYSGFLAAMCYADHLESTNDPEAPKMHEKHLSELPLQVPAVADRRNSDAAQSLASAKRMLSRSQAPTPLVPTQPQPPYPFLPRPSPIDPPARAYVPPLDQPPSGNAAEPFNPYLPYLQPPPPKRPAQLTISIPPRTSHGQTMSYDARRVSIPTRPPSQMPSPATPKSSSRSTSRVTSMQQPSLPPINESDDSSPKSSGRLSKPSPFMYAS